MIPLTSKVSHTVLAVKIVLKVKELGGTISIEYFSKILNDRNCEHFENLRRNAEIFKMFTFLFCILVKELMIKQQKTRNRNSEKTRRESRREKTHGLESKKGQCSHNVEQIFKC